MKKTSSDFQLFEFQKLPVTLQDLKVVEKWRLWNIIPQQTCHFYWFWKNSSFFDSIRIFETFLYHLHSTANLLQSRGTSWRNSVFCGKKLVYNKLWSFSKNFSAGLSSRSFRGFQFFFLNVNKFGPLSILAWTQLANFGLKNAPFERMILLPHYKKYGAK